MNNKIIETKPNEYYVPYKDEFGPNGLIAYKGVVYKTNENGLLEVENNYLISRLNLLFFKKVDENYVGKVSNEIIKSNYVILTIN
jgi:hypothetical protein